MSELFAARVTEVTPEYAVMEVRSVHPDSGPPMPTATFALMLMYDPIINSGYSAFRKYRHLESSALAQAMDRDDYLNASWVPANARAFVARAKVSRGTLTIWPTHPGWIEHLRVGMAWDTAAYSAGPGQAVPKRAPAPAGAVSARASDPAAGFRVGTPKIDDCTLKGAFIAQHGANRYVAEPVITDPTAMATAARGMIGQPVIVVPKRGPKEIGTIVAVHDTGVSLYAESEWGWGGGMHYYKDLRSLGRAWLAVSAGASAKVGGDKGAKKVAKVGGKQSVKKVAKVAGKQSAKKVAKAAGKQSAKQVGKAGAKKVGRAAGKKSAQKVARVGVKKAARVGAKKVPATGRKREVSG